MTTEERKKKFLEEYKKLVLEYSFDMVPYLKINELGIKPSIIVVELPESVLNKTA